MSRSEMNDADCIATQNQMYEYLHYELDAQHLAAIRQHLTECADCSQEYSMEQIVRDLLHRSCHCTAPPTLRSAILTMFDRVDPTGS